MLKPIAGANTITIPLAVTCLCWLSLKYSKVQLHGGLGGGLILSREGRWPPDCLQIPSLQAKQWCHRHSSICPLEGQWESMFCLLCCKEEREGSSILDKEAKVAFLYFCWISLHEQPHLSKHDEKWNWNKGEKGRNQWEDGLSQPRP